MNMDDHNQKIDANPTTIPDPRSMVFDQKSWVKKFLPGRKGHTKDSSMHQGLVRTAGAVDPRIISHETTHRYIHKHGDMNAELANALGVKIVSSDDFYGDAVYKYYQRYRAADVATGALSATSHHRYLDAATVTRKVDAPLASAIRLRLDAEQPVSTAEREWYDRWTRINDYLAELEAKKTAHDVAQSKKPKGLPDPRLSDPEVLDRAIAAMQGDCQTPLRTILTAQRRLIAHLPNHSLQGVLSSGKEYELALDGRTSSEAARLVNKPGVPETNLYDSDGETLSILVHKNVAGANAQKAAPAQEPLVVQCRGTLLGECLATCHELAKQAGTMYLLFDRKGDKHVGRSAHAVEEMRRHVLKAACKELGVEPSDDNLSAHRKRGEGTKQSQQLRHANPNEEQEICRVTERTRHHNANNSVAGTYNAPQGASASASDADPVVASKKRPADPGASEDSPLQKRQLPKRTRTAILFGSPPPCQRSDGGASGDSPLQKRQLHQRTRAETLALMQAEITRHAATMSALVAEMGPNQ